MVWTQQEQQLIAVLDDFVDHCSQSDRFKNSNYHRLLQQILAVTKGELKATQDYCQQILSTNKNPIPSQQVDSTNIFIPDNSPPAEPTKLLVDRENSNSAVKSTSPLVVKNPSPSAFKSYWTGLFLLATVIVVFFVAQKSPNQASLNTFSNVALLCPTSLIETAQLGIKNHNKLVLEKALAEFKRLQQLQSEQLGLECEQVLWETQSTYAIDFLASQGQIKKAITHLCEISPTYYQGREVIPWFTRWSNTNQELRNWLAEYKANNDCAVASYLE